VFALPMLGGPLIDMLEWGLNSLPLCQQLQPRDLRRRIFTLAAAEAAGDNLQFVRRRKAEYHPHSYAAIGMASLLAVSLL